MARQRVLNDNAMFLTLYFDFSLMVSIMMLHCFMAEIILCGSVNCMDYTSNPQSTVIFITVCFYFICMSF